MIDCYNRSAEYMTMDDDNEWEPPTAESYIDSLPPSPTEGPFSDEEPFDKDEEYSPTEESPKESEAIELFKEGIRQMIVNEQSGGDGWWEGFEKLKRAYLLHQRNVVPTPVESPIEGESAEEILDRIFDERDHYSRGYILKAMKEYRSSAIIFPSQEEVRTQFPVNVNMDSHSISENTGAKSGAYWAIQRVKELNNIK